MLLLFGNGPGSLGLTEVARRLGVNKAAAHRSLSTLRSRGFLDYDPDLRRYRLGVRLHELVSAAGRPRLTAAALPHLEWLRDATGETASLHVRDGWSRLCVLWAESRQPVRRVAEAGRPFPLHCGGSGPVLLGGLDDEELEVYLREAPREPVTPQTVVDADRLRAVVHEVRRCGYAIADRDRVADAAGVSAPIRDTTNQVIAAISVSGPTPRCDRDWAIASAPAVVEAARRLSLALGWKPGDGRRTEDGRGDGETGRRGEGIR